MASSSDYRITLLNEAGIQTDLQDSVAHLGNLMNHLSTKKPKLQSVKSAINGLYESYSAAEARLNASIESLRRECEDEGARLSVAQSKVRGMEADLRSMTHTLEEKKKRVEAKAELLKEAKENVEFRRRVKSEKEDKLEEAQKVQKGTMIAAVGVSAIPVVGWVAGPALFVVSVTALESAVKDAASSLDSARSSLSRASNDYDEAKQARDDAKRETENQKEKIASQERKIAASKEKIKNIRKKLEEENRELNQLRKIMQQISQLSGRAEVLQLESRSLYDVSTLYEPLRSIMDLLIERPYRPPQQILDKFEAFTILVQSRPALTEEPLGSGFTDDWV